MLGNPILKLGNMVVIIHDPSKTKRMIVRVINCLDGSTIYGLSMGEVYSEHCIQEIKLIDGEV